MKKILKRIVSWIGNIRYFLSYSLKSIERSISLDQRALKIAIKYPISPEEARHLIEVAEGLGISDTMVEKLVHHSALMGYDRSLFPLEIMCAFKTELIRMGKYK